MTSTALELKYASTGVFPSLSSITTKASTLHRPPFNFLSEKRLKELRELYQIERKTFLIIGHALKTLKTLLFVQCTHLLYGIHFSTVSLPTFECKDVA